MAYYANSKAEKPFQSTLPVRGATCDLSYIHCERACFNPRSPCGERREAGREKAALAEFQSTLPVRGATYRLG